MENQGNRGWWVPESLLGLVVDTGRFILERLKPVFTAMMDVMGQGTLGVLIVTGLLFIIWLVRMGASSKATEAYGYALLSLGRWGFAAIVVYFIVLGLERVVLPLAVIGLIVLVHTALGGDLTFAALARNWSYPEARRQFITDLTGFMGGGESMLPLSPRAALLLGLAFACMWLVGRLFFDQKRRVG